MLVGCSLGNVADMASDRQNLVLDAIKKVAPGGVIRTPIKWNPGNPIPWSKYESFATRVKNHNLIWVADVHTAIVGGGEYADPGPSWSAKCKEVANWIKNR